MATPRPKPQRAFSLKVGVGARECDSYATKRTEFEPISTIATGSPGKRPCALVSSIDDPARGRSPDAVVVYQHLPRSAIGKESLRAWPRPERLGLVWKYLCALNGCSPSAGTILSLDPSGNTRKLCSSSIKFASMI